MISKNIKDKELKPVPSDNFCLSELCEVSKASKEIMLDRFCEGKQIDFPFSE